MTQDENPSEAQEEYDVSKSRRFDEPVNEFVDGEYGMVAAFPNVFLFGKAYLTSTTLTEKQRCHLLMQFTNAAASNQHFLFSEFDKLQRHSTVRGMHGKVKADPKEFEDFTKKFMKKEFQDKLKRAVANP